MGLIREFKEFAARGNVMDLAVGVVIAGAFGLIVTSFVNDILMPPIGMALGQVDFADLKTVLKPASIVDGKPVPEVAIRYGAFLNTIINFLIVAFAVFMVVKGMNSMKRKQAPAPESGPVTKECPFCISTIPIKARRCPNCTSEIPASV